MPSPVIKAVEVVAIPALTIKEFHGGASTNESKLSAVHEIVSAASNSNPWRCPEFSEYILVVDGEAHVEHGSVGGVKTDVVKAGCGIFLPEGCRVRVNYPGPAEIVAICLPAFSPAIEHAEKGDTTATDTAKAVPAHKTDSKPTLVESVDVVKAPALTITEYFGNVASADGTLSACVAKVGEPCSEAWQCPEFAEWVLVLSGALHLEHERGTTIVPAGSGVYLEANERVKWVWPEACTYVPICMPAFTPDGCRREPEEGSAKDAAPETMAELHKLHRKVREEVNMEY
jgi:ethanolamine utilization protein EutQ (cupin superfamily)